MKIDLFNPAGQGSSWKVESVAGVTTFLTMSYILFVQPVVLARAGMDHGAVFTATALSSAIATLLMGLLAKYPIALAPAMGHNFFFTFTVVLGMGIAWPRALGAVFISGALFIILSTFGLRERIINVVPPALKAGIAVGIGLLITLIGMEWSGLVVAKPGTLVGLGDLSSPVVLLSLFGVAVIALLMALKVRGSFIVGILASTTVALFTGMIHYNGIFSAPPSLSPTFLHLDIAGAVKLHLWDIIFVFFFLDLFDTIGTLIGVAEQAGFMRDGKLPRARKALLSDAIGTVVGAIFGTSTVTSYIESAAGVAEGGKTGTANLFTAGLFFVSLWFYPLIAMVGEGVAVGKEQILYPTLAPVLIIVGLLMFKLTRTIIWEDPTEAIPAYLAMILMPLTFSITEGIAFGFIAYSFLKIVTGKMKETSWLVHLVALLFLARYLFLSM